MVKVEYDAKGAQNVYSSWIALTAVYAEYVCPLPKQQKQKPRSLPCQVETLRHCTLLSMTNTAGQGIMLRSIWSQASSFSARQNLTMGVWSWAISRSYAARSEWRSMATAYQS